MPQELFLFGLIYHQDPRNLNLTQLLTITRVPLTSRVPLSTIMPHGSPTIQVTQIELVVQLNPVIAKPSVALQRYTSCHEQRLQPEIRTQVPQIVPRSRILKEGLGLSHEKIYSTRTLGSSCTQLHLPARQWRPSKKASCWSVRGNRLAKPGPKRI